MQFRRSRAMLPVRMRDARNHPIGTLHRLSAEQRRLLVHAIVVLTAASAAVALLPFRRAVSFGHPAPGGKRRPNVSDCVWAVKAAAKRLPWRTMCIEQGIALQRMLRRGGVDAVLHYGARHDLSGGLQAHVWVSVAGRTIIGGEEAPGFAEIATYP